MFAGVDGAGKGATVTLLNEWMDARWLINRAYREPSDEERERPEYWRFWRDLPPKGRIGLYLSSWYSRPVIDRVHERISGPEFEERLDRILNFENALAQDGALILKFWMHLSQPEQKKRLRALERDPLQSWQVVEKDWEHWRLYDCFIEAAERLIMRTNVGAAPWTIVEGVDPCYRSVTVATTIRDAIRKRLDEIALADAVKAEQAKLESKINGKEKGSGAEVDAALTISKATVLSQLDLNQRIEKVEYKTKLIEYQAKLSQLHHQAFETGISTIALFEGPDAAGKGGAIRRVISALDPHIYQVLPFAAPTDEEKAQQQN